MLSRVWSVGVGRKERGAREDFYGVPGTPIPQRKTASCQSQISFMGTDRLPTVDFGHRSYPRMLARCLTHEGRNTVSGFLPHPDP